jgi:hypothetical protein
MNGFASCQELEAEVMRLEARSYLHCKQECVLPKELRRRQKLSANGGDANAEHPARARGHRNNYRDSRSSWMDLQRRSCVVESVAVAFLVGKEARLLLLQRRNDEG